MGHVVRCLALAGMLKHDFNITFAIQDPAESVVKTIHTVTETIVHLPQTDDYNKDALNFSQFLNTDDIVVLDGYNFKTDYQKTIKNIGCKLVCIDDLHAWHFIADAVINHAEGVSESDYSKEPHTKLLLGLDYVLLRKEFLEASGTIKKISSVKKVFISMGAADLDNLTQKFTQALLEIKGIEEINLMLGFINPHLKSIKNLIESSTSTKIKTHLNISAAELLDLLKNCDAVICPASSISLEACAVGTGLISGFTAANQTGILKGLIENNAAINIGDMVKISAAEIRSEVEKLCAHPDQLNTLIENQKRMIDCQSPQRIKKLFSGLITEKLHFRFAKESDAAIYFKWTNDPLVRQNSYNQNVVDYDHHINWFLSKLNSKECYFYLFFNEMNVPAGQVRIDSNGKETIIGISIDEAFRGRSIGSEMLKKACSNYLNKYPEAVITAYIKFDNAASYAIFKKAGFANEEIVQEQGFKSYKLYKKLS